MVEMDTLASKVFALLKGNGLKIKIFNIDGAETVDPTEGRRFFVISPNIMVTINEDGNSVEFNKGANVDEDSVAKLQKNIRKLADEFLMNTSIKVYGKMMKPKDYAYQAKMQKETTMMENNTVQPYNHQLLGKILHKVKYFGDAGAHTIADDLGLSLSDVQPILNRLVTTGKITAQPDAHGEMTYTASVEEAVMESDADKTTQQYEVYDTRGGKKVGGPYSSLSRANAAVDRLDNKFGGYRYKHRPVEAMKEGTKEDQLKQVMKYSAVKGQDNRDLGRHSMGGDPNKPVPRISKFAFPANTPSQVQKKKMTPFESTEVMEVSNELLGRYKTAAGKDASAADKKGDYKKGDKRFSGVVKATNKQFANDAKQTHQSSIKESISKMFGSARTSQQTFENVRILVRHKTPVDENVRGSRTRHISAIFLECNGERMRFQHNSLGGARAMAQHMAHGGTMTDKVGAYISESTGQLLQLQSFNRYVSTNKLINEDSSGIIETIKENIDTLKVELKKLTGTKTYETVKARLETFEREPLSEDDTSQLKDMFTIRRFDEKFEQVLPIVKQLMQEKDTFVKRIEEAAGNVISVRHESITTPIFEFASENARLGFKINELALRIIENEELAGFVNKIGTKVCKEGMVNKFERAILYQVLENVKVEGEGGIVSRTEIKESVSLTAFFDRYDYKFM